MGWHIEEATKANWPRLPRYRGAGSRVGYPSREAAACRLAHLEMWAAAEYGQQGGPRFSLVERAPSREPLKLTFNVYGAILSDRDTGVVTHSVVQPMWEIEGSKWSLRKRVGQGEKYVGSFDSLEAARAHADRMAR